MSALWEAEEMTAATQATHGKMIGNWRVSGLSIDSREIAKGDLFIALKAERDGHDFVRAAIDAGAAGALVSHIPEGCEDAPLLIVDDVEKAMAAMGQYRRAQVNAQIVAVTGSAGKTSTKEMLLKLLGAFGKTHASVKSFNNHWGVPLTLARMPRDCDFAVFEIGMNHPGEIAPLVAQVRPDCAIITNVAPVHMAGFNDESEIAREKAAILSGLSKEGFGIVYGDMVHRDLIASISGNPIRWFGRDKKNDIRLLQSDGQAEYSQGCFELGGQRYDFRINVGGAHHMQNALAVFAVIDAFELDMKKATQALESWQAPSGRGQVFTVSYQGGEITIVDESYNANPLSMKAALESFVLRPAKRRIAVLGDMRELGEGSCDFHRDISKIEALSKLDIIHSVGDEMRALDDVLDRNKGAHFASVDDLIEAMPSLFSAGDTLLFKGSNGIGLGRAVDALKHLGQSKGK